MAVSNGGENRADPSINDNNRCVFTAALGMATVVWYTFGGDLSEEEIEEEVKAKIAAKERRGRFFGLMPPKNQ